MKLQRVLWGAPFILLACVSPGVDPIGTNRQAVVGGTRDTHDPAVVMILQRPTAGSNDVAIICTGAVVSPHVVLTAAHCIDPAAVGDGVFSVFLGDDVDDSAQFGDAKRRVDAVETHLHPDWVLKTVGTKHDIAVLVTSTALSPTPLPMNRDTLGQDFVGTPLRAVGSGQTSAADPSSSGRMFELTTTAKAVEDEHLVFEDSSKSLCHGDSGGPTFAKLGGSEVIVGVHSGTTQDCTGENVDTRVDLYAASFVDPYIAAADPGFEPVGRKGSADGGTPATKGDAGPDEASPNAAEPAPQTTSSSCGLGGAGSSHWAGMLLGACALLAARRRQPSAL